MKIINILLVALSGLLFGMIGSHPDAGPQVDPVAHASSPGHGTAAMAVTNRSLPRDLQGSALASAVLTEPVTIHLPLVASKVTTVLPEKIAFESLRDGNYEIYLINPDGSEVTRLTMHPAKDAAPAWSPDGRRLAFISDRDGDDEIYVMARDGTGMVQLTHNDADDDWPTWSPDGTRIAFQSNRDDPGVKFDIYVMNADGSGQTRLTTHSGEDRWPDWSPDGLRIAYTSNRIYKKIFRMNADGSGQTMVSDPVGYYDDFYPTWSPDGRITFVSNRPALTDGSRDDEIYIMRTGGSGVQQLTNNRNGIGDWLARWSPDGSRFSFYSDRDGNKNIFAYVLATREEIRLTDHPSDDEYPAWSP
jgi:TolB protein